MSDSILNLCVVGVGGRMGQELVRAIADRTDVRLVGAFARKNSCFFGQDAGISCGTRPLGLKITDDFEHACESADAILDFTSPAGTQEFLSRVLHERCMHIIGTTGFSPSDLMALKRYGEKKIIVYSGNMSIGANLLGALARLAARSLGSCFDVRIIDMHHRHKVDSPSGTALLLREVIQAEVREHDIPIASLRCGSVVGEHSVVFAGPGERVTLTHSAEQRSIFATGALRAALWAREQKDSGVTHGFFTMADVLGLDKLFA
jgi:4-hydroxy-tetrahydrodipicolinate reductase